MNHILFRAPRMKGPGPRNPLRPQRASKYPEGVSGSPFARIWGSDLRPNAKYTDYSGTMFVVGAGGEHRRVGKAEKAVA